MPPVRFERLAYDVVLGGANAIGHDQGHELAPLWERLLKKRVDVVGETADTSWIIEVKPTASMASLGQVLTYEWLGRAERVWKEKTLKVVVCGWLDADLEGVFKKFGVNVWSVGDPASAEFSQPIRRA